MRIKFGHLCERCFEMCYFFLKFLNLRYGWKDLNSWAICFLIARKIDLFITSLLFLSSHFGVSLFDDNKSIKVFWIEFSSFSFLFWFIEVSLPFLIRFCIGGDDEFLFKIFVFQSKLWVLCIYEAIKFS